MERDTRLTRLFDDGNRPGDGDGGGWHCLLQGLPLATGADLYAFRHRAFSPLPGRWAPQDPLGYADDGPARYDPPSRSLPPEYDDGA